ncbi:MAG TPA: hypothetical protein VIJ25_11545 [Methylococcales bacterium]
MSVQRCGTQPSNKGPEEYFTGNVRVDPLIQPPRSGMRRCRQCDN